MYSTCLLHVPFKEADSLPPSIFSHHQRHPAAHPTSLPQGFLPTVLEDVPDMAVKFAVYEMMRNLHSRLNGGRPANVAEDLVMGGVAGAAAAAATTPLDVVKTVMMCSASSRPTIVSAAAGIMREGQGLRPFFRGVGPRALSNGLNSAIFFCFFEAIRQVRRAAGLAGVALPQTEDLCIGRGCGDLEQGMQRHGDGLVWLL